VCRYFGIHYEGGCTFGYDLTGCRQASEGSLVDIARTEAADVEMVRMIERRSRKGEVDPDELESLYMESIRRYNARRREENRRAWCGYFERLAAKLRARAEELDHRAQTLLEDRGSRAIDPM
jgi:hypothetical protein